MMVETGSPDLAPICCEALRAGKHAIADVPMIDSRKDCWDLVVADPPRTGLGEAGVSALLAGKPRAIAYVSCDPASLARDTRLLGAAGYRLDWAAPVDLFPQTFHIETVAAFRAA